MAPFRPEHYTEAIVAADKAGYPVIVVDSTSHVWAGDGGCLDWHDEIVEQMVERKRKLAEDKGWQFDEWRTREASNISAWIDPKTSHKRMVQRLLQLRAHVILCFRAEEKIEIVKEQGKTVVRPKVSITGAHGWIPLCEKSLPFELTTSLLLTADAPGIPKPIKLQEQHRSMVPLDQPITEDTGKALAAWASGGAKPEASTKPATAPGSPDKGSLLKALQLAASHGMASLKADWAALTKAEQDTINAAEFQALKKAAKEADTP
jgi:hypothetical protein